MTYGNSNGTPVKDKNNNRDGSQEKHVSTVNKLPQNAKVPQAHSQKEEHGSVSLLKDWFLTIPKRKWNIES